MNDWSLILSLARRNFWRQRRRNASLLLAVAIGMMATLAGSFLIRGYQLSTLSETVEQLGGSVLLHNRNWQLTPEPHNSIDLSTSRIQALDATGLPWMSRIKSTVTLQSERETRGVMLYGIDIERERAETGLQRLTIDGSKLHTSQRGIIIGAALANDLETRLGKRIVLLAQNANQQRTEVGLRIIGIFHANSATAERAKAYVTTATAQRILGLEGRTTEISVGTNNILDTSAQVQQLENIFPDLAVRDWRDIEPIVWAMYQLVDGMVVIYQIIFLAALAFGLVNTLVAAVLERTREFGLLMAVGMRPISILKQVLVESWLILFTGLALGGLGSAALYYWLSSGIDVSKFVEGMDVPGMTRPLFPVVVITDVASLIGIILVFGFIASLYPAYRAVRLDPVTALNRH